MADPIRLSPNERVLRHWPGAGWLPAIPEPMRGLRPAGVLRCDCGSWFWTHTAYRGHYALAHILEADRG